MRVLAALLLLVHCGCTSTYHGPRPVQTLVNTLTQTHCEARSLKSIGAWQGADGKWFYRDGDGKIQPVDRDSDEPARSVTGGTMTKGE